MTSNSHFGAVRNGKGSTYTCTACGKKTRETGSGESECSLCVECFDDINQENALSDGASSKAAPEGEDADYAERGAMIERLQAAYPGLKD